MNDINPFDDTMKGYDDILSFLDNVKTELLNELLVELDEKSVIITDKVKAFTITDESVFISEQLEAIDIIMNLVNVEKKMVSIKVSKWL